MDRGAWWAIFHRLTKSWTQLKWLAYTSTHMWTLNYGMYDLVPLPGIEPRPLHWEHRVVGIQGSPLTPLFLRWSEPWYPYASQAGLCLPFMSQLGHRVPRGAQVDTCVLWVSLPHIVPGLPLFFCWSGSIFLPQAPLKAAALGNDMYDITYIFKMSLWLLCGTWRKGSQSGSREISRGSCGCPAETWWFGPRRWPWKYFYLLDYKLQEGSELCLEYLGILSF